MDKHFGALFVYSVIFALLVAEFINNQPRSNSTHGIHALIVGEKEDAYAHSIWIPCANLPGKFSIMPDAHATQLTYILNVLKFIAPSCLDKDSWTTYNNELNEKLSPLHNALANDLIAPDLAGNMLIEETIDFLQSKPDLAPSKKHSKNFINNNQSIEKAKTLKNSLRKAAKQSKDPSDQKKFYKALRTYNVMRRNKQKSEKVKSTSYQESLYHDNFWNFSKSVCSGTFGKDQVYPSFNKELADEFYPGKYSVPEPIVPEALNWYTEIAAPHHEFDLGPILPKHVRNIIKDKSNSSSPGPDGISYSILKKLTCLHRILATLYNKILDSGIPPSKWGQSKITLIYKKGSNCEPTNFRMIALASTFGKIFHQILAQRTTDFMLKNKYIDSQTQKAFISKINGTIEHNQLLQEIIKHSKHHKKTVHITFFDLEDAFGSVSHDLIAQSLDRYHFPAGIKNYVSSLYNNLEGTTITKEWQSHPFKFRKGIFQGDPWSPIIFLIVFNPLIEKLTQLKDKGYNLDNNQVITTPFADDFNLITNNKTQHQRIINDLLSWTTSMKLKLKPSKCVTMSITSGKPIINNFFLGPERIGTLECSTHKFLGSTITFSGKQNEIFEVVKTHFVTRLERIDKTLIRGEFKCKIYKDYLLSASRFILTIHNLTKTNITCLEALCHKYLKSWSGIARCGNTDIIHSNRYLNILSISELYDQCQTTAHISSRAKGDKLVNAALDSRLNHELEWSRKLSTAVTSEDAYNIAAAKCNIVGQTKHKAKDTLTKYAKKCISSNNQKTYQDRLGNLQMQGELLRLIKESESDMCWKSAIYNLPKGIMSFILNSSLNTLPVRDNLKRWGKCLSNSCRHCGMPEYLSHVLVGCKTFLEQGRYTFRHDSVLHVLDKMASDLTSTSPNIEVLSDLTNKDENSGTIPPEIIPTVQRPDLVIINRQCKEITIVELTVPYETNIQKEHNYKTEKYQYLISDISSTGYTVTFYAIEIGCRGIITKDNKNRIYKLIKQLSATPPKSKYLKDTLQKLTSVAVAASYAIFSARKYTNWIARDILRA